MSPDSQPSSAEPAIVDATLPPGLSAALRSLGNRGAGALDAFTAALATEVSANWRALALLGRGLCHELGGDRSAANDDVNAAFQLWTAADPADHALALAALGHALAVESGDRVAAAYFGAARRLAGSTPAEVVGAVLLEVGAAAAEAGEVAAAAASWREAQDRGGPLSRAAAAANLGRLAAAGGDRAAAQVQFDIALQVNDGPHLRVVADGLVAMAAVEIAAERWLEAEADLRQALPIRQAEHDARAVAEILHDLGVTHWRRGQPEQASRWFDDCRSSAQAAGDDVLLTAALRGLAALALAAGRPVVALAYAHEAGVTARRPEDRRASARLLQDIGERARADGAASLSGEAFRIAAALLS